VFGIDKKLFFWGFLFISFNCLASEAGNAYYQSAKLLWEKDDIPSAVEKLLLACSHRKSPFKAYSNLKLSRQIQRSLLDHPSPIESFSFSLKILFNKNLQIIWASVSFWVLCSGLFVLWILNKRRAGLIVLGLGSLCVLTGAVSFYFSHSFNDPLYVIREGDKAHELPLGLLVTNQPENEENLRVEKPYLRKVLLKPTGQ